jgi:cold shock CspA family protein
MRVAYIAGPYAGNIKENIRRALMLAKIAASEGYAVIVPHTAGEDTYGPDSKATSRMQALEAGKEIAFMVGQYRGVLYVLLTESGFTTEGVNLEINAFKDAGGTDIIYFRSEVHLVRAP